MKENKLLIKIRKPISEVFNFTIDPNNTPKWIDFIVEEKAELPIAIGTKYTNINSKGEKADYLVSAFEINKLFELEAIGSDFTVRYTYTPISDNETELEYFEWVRNGEIADPFLIQQLAKLKQVMEK